MNNNNNNENNYNKKNTYNEIITSNTPTPAPAATNNNTRSNGTQACAACKYQRRKCAPDCILAPYFPHHRQRHFLNAHKLFGVSNITKIIRYLDQPHKDEAMRTIIYQSDVRATDHVGGCYRIIRELQRQIEYNRAELQLVLHQLACCRAQNRFDNVDLLHDEMRQYYHDGDDRIIQRPDDQDQEQYILNGDDQVHFEEINSWEATESSATLEVKKSCESAEIWREDINAKLVSEDQREGLRLEAEEKSFESVNDFRLETTPAI